MRQVISMEKLLPGWVDAQGMTAEMDETGMMFAPCTRCGREMASPCPADMLYGRECNDCAMSDDADMDTYNDDSDLAKLLGPEPQ